MYYIPEFRQIILCFVISLSGLFIKVVIPLSYNTHLFLTTNNYYDRMKGILFQMWNNIFFSTQCREKLSPNGDNCISPASRQEKLYHILSYFQEKYNVYREIYKDVSFWTLVQFIVYKLKTYIKSLVNDVVLTQVNNDSYHVTYYENERKYCIAFPKKRGPKKIVQVNTMDINGNLVNITDKFFEFMGPCNNFHGIKTTPKLLGYNNVILHYRNSSIIRYEASDEIHLEF